jgi:PAS domain S-box-containing protein
LWSTSKALHSDAAREFGFEYGRPFRIQDDFPVLTPLVAAKAAWQDVLEDRNGDTVVSAAARLKLGVNASVAVVDIVPHAVVVAPVRAVAYAALLAGLAVAIGALVFAVLIARSLTRPLRQLTAAVQAFGRDEPMALPTHAAGEIGVLVREFGLLVDGIKSRSMAIDRYAKRESLYAAAVHSASLAFLTTDSDAIITAWNPGAERLFGYLADEVIGRDVEMLIPADRRGDIADIRGKCQDGEWIKNYATMRVGKSGKPIDVIIDISPLRSPTGQLVGSTAIIRDITEQRLAEELFHIAVEGSPSGMLMVDRAGKIVMVNGEIEKLFGYQRDELLGQGIEILVPHHLRANHMKLREQFIKHEIGGPVVRGRHLSGLRKDGSEFFAEIELNAVHARDGIVVLANIMDVSERRRAEMIKQEFVSTVSHELRTPLTSVTASLALLSSGSAGPLSAPAARLLTIAHANSQRLVRLVNDILDIEKYDSGKMVFTVGQVNTRAVVEQVIEMNRAYADEFGVTVRLQSGSETSGVRADADRLAQVIANLLSNAIKFSPRGEEVAVVIADEGDTIRISVRDHGPGIPHEFKPHVFERFAQADASDARKKGGTGLGLSIVKQIIDGIGGHIGFESARGGGTIFFVTIPRWDADAGSRMGAARPDIENREVA